MIVLHLSPEGNIAQVSPHYERVTGHRIDEIRGKNWFETFLPPAQRDAARSLITAADHGLSGGSVTAPILTRDNEERQIEWRAIVLREGDGRATSIIAIGTDVTESLELAAATEHDRRRLRSIIDGMFAYVGLYTTDGVLIEANRAPIEAAGLRNEDVIGRPFWETYWWSYSPAVQMRVRQALSRAALGETVRDDFVVRMGEDRFITIDAMFGPLRDPDGRITGIVGSGVDVTARKQSEEALRVSQQRLTEAQRLARMGSWDLDLIGGTLIWSDEIYRIFEVEKSRFGASYEAFLAMVHPDDRDAVNKTYTESVTMRWPYQMVHRLRMSDGRVKWVEERGQTKYDTAGAPLRSIGTVQDITDRQQIELAMQVLSADLIRYDGPVYIETAAHRLAALLDAEVAFVCRFDASKNGELRTVALVIDGILKQNLAYPTVQTPWANAADGQPCYVACDARQRYPEDEFLSRHQIEACAGETLLDSAGRAIGLIGVMSRSQFRNSAPIRTTLQMFGVAVSAAMGRERTRRQYMDLFEVAPGGLIMVDRRGRINLANQQAENMLGWTRGELTGKPIEVLVPQASRGAHVRLRDEFIESPARRNLVAGLEGLRARRKDGTEFPVEIELSPLESEDGTMIAASIRDITSRLQLEAELAQARKLEAIGRLTGGMAHDFNNYLGVIIGNLDLVKLESVTDTTAKRLIDTALRAALSAATVTNGLLAFARRQPLDPQLTDVNRRVTSIVELVKSTLGEAITLALYLAPELWPVKVDSGQLDSCIMNLANNARDAMPQGGTLTISTRNMHLDRRYARKHPDLSAGDYVVIELFDTGSGIPLEVLAQVFEPFFTTKQSGQGTGLGLSTVYGFVKQSGGHVTIDSEVGHGTTVRVYLPRAGEGALEDRAAEIAAAPRTGTETILLVEDKDRLRQTVMEQLATLGYRVIEAGNGTEALEILDQSELHLDLLFSDIILPGSVDGCTLANLALERRPAIKVLLTSGFSGDRLLQNDGSGPVMPFLSKPYRLNDLAYAVRAALQTDLSKPS